jgi:methionyl-tRNA formyltransferase
MAGAILAGDVFTGISLMIMDRGMDTGPLLSQCQIPVLDSDNTQSLGKRLSLIAAGMVSATLPEWAQGLIQPRQQDNELATYSGLIVREAGCIDWQDSAEDLWRKSRAYLPWPGIYTTWKGRKLKLIRTVPIFTGTPGLAGSVIPLEGAGGAWFGIATSEGILGVLNLQMEGKTTVTSAEFLRGHPGIIGSVLPD